MRGGFNFLPKWDENRALDIENASCIPGARLLAATYGNYTCQAFLLEPLSETIRSEAAFTPDGNYLSTVTDATGHTVSYLYNPDGTVKEVTDGKGVKTEYTYDPNNGALLTTRTDGSEVSYTYVDDRLTTITTPSGTVYTFLYDSFGRTKSVQLNRKNSTAAPRTLATYTYNSSLTDYNGSPHGIAQMTYGNGYVTETEYDAVSGLVTEDGKLSYDYVAGTLHSTGDAGDKPTDTYYHYDLAGRLISVARFEAAPTSNTVFSLAYRYRDGSGLLDYTSFSDENFHLKSSWRYGNIDLGEVPDVVYDVLFNDALAVSYTYDGFYRRNTRTLHVGDGITTTYRFMNGAGENTTTAVVESVSEGGFTTSYTYDGNGNILSIVRINDATGAVVESRHYRYDGKNQLIFEGESATSGTTLYLRQQR